MLKVVNIPQIQIIILKAYKNFPSVKVKNSVDLKRSDIQHFVVVAIVVLTISRADVIIVRLHTNVSCLLVS